jgi:putative transposase
LLPACRVVGISARTIERWRNQPEGDDGRCGPQRRPRNALSATEHAQILAVLACSRYADLSPRQLVPHLADEGLYLASESTLYRLQRRYGLRRKKPAAGRTHATRAATLHRATGPNQVWSWDITWLPTTVRGLYLHLYLVMDVWSRRIVGWHIAENESADTAAQLITRICRDSNVDPRGLVLHSDNGMPMRGSTMISTLQWLGVVPSFSRPHVSDDNPYSEGQFRTMKYRPEFPDRFGCIQDSRAFSQGFFRWYNEEHHHSGLALLTPAMVHYEQTPLILEQRQSVLDGAYRVHPERFVRQAPKPPSVPTEVWINRPANSDDKTH